LFSLRRALDAALLGRQQSFQCFRLLVKGPESLPALSVERIRGMRRTSQGQLGAKHAKCFDPPRLRHPQRIEDFPTDIFSALAAPVVSDLTPPRLRYRVEKDPMSLAARALRPYITCPYRKLSSTFLRLRQALQPLDLPLFYASPRRTSRIYPYFQGGCDGFS